MEGQDAEAADSLGHRIPAQVRRSAIELLGDYQLTTLGVVPVPVGAMVPGVVAAVGFTGDLTGTMYVAADGGVVRATSGDGDAWLGELANQLLGRTKNSLWVNRIELHMAPPALVDPARAAAVPGQRLATPAGDLQVWIEWEAAPGTTWHPATSTRRVRVLSEGDLLLF